MGKGTVGGQSASPDESSALSTLAITFAKPPRLTGEDQHALELQGLDRSGDSACACRLLNPRHVVRVWSLGCKMLWIHGANLADNPFFFKGENQHGRYYYRRRIRPRQTDGSAPRSAGIPDLSAFIQGRMRERSRSGEPELRAGFCAIGTAVLPRAQRSGW